MEVKRKGPPRPLPSDMTPVTPSTSSPGLVGTSLDPSQPPTPASPPRHLTPRQQIFVHAYLATFPDLNGTQAAIRAGYSRKTAKAQATQLLSKLDVKREVERLVRERYGLYDVTAQRVLEEINAIAFANVYNFMAVTPDGKARIDLRKLTYQTAAAIQEITTDEYQVPIGDDESAPVIKTRVKLADKMQALSALAKIYKLLPQGEGGMVNVQINLATEMRTAKDKFVAKLGR